MTEARAVAAGEGPHSDIPALAAEAAVMRRLSESLSGGLEMEKVARAIVDLVVEEVGAANCSLYLLDGERTALVLCAARGQEDRAAAFYPNGGEYRRFAVGEGACGWVAREGKSLLIDDVTKDPRFTYKGALSSEVRSLLAVPLKADDKVVGVVNLSHTDLGAFTKKSESLLGLVSAQAGIALSNVQLFSRLAEANRLLAESEGRLRELFSRLNDPVLLIDGEGRVVEANRQWEEFAGQPDGKWEGIALETADGRRRTFPEFLRQDAFVSEGVKLEAVMSRPGGPSSVVEIASKAFPFGSKKVCLVSIRDVTESKRLAEQLIRSEKLAAIGEVTAALAHEVNNPLGALYNAVCLLKSDLKLGGDNGRLLEVAVEEATHLSEIVNDFLSFARFPHARFAWNDLNKLVSDALFLMRRDERMTAGMEVDTALAEDLAEAQVDRNQFQEVVFNLLSNALDAMPEGGVLTIKTYNAKLGGKPAVGILVEDTGVGIEPEHRDKIFAPFFTTKEVGTGLGLSIVKRIVEEHQGVVSIESAPGMGCKASVVVPVSREEARWRPY